MLSSIVKSEEDTQRASRNGRISTQDHRYQSGALCHGTNRLVQQIIIQYFILIISQLKFHFKNQILIYGQTAGTSNQSATSTLLTAKQDVFSFKYFIKWNKYNIYKYDNDNCS